ncbi:hypothetical protein RF11_13064 [Thelohanellus kitauei]|uniref:Uncharacterized protein n=1 Tax=Thelohanellus kitauei TaxID=669202 RepID=A0A0C2JKB7_THEKT|nr:hypothetical protein RF11_13064 [Thelohanellus kitauei]
MNISLGGWRMPCTNLYEKTRFNAKIIYDSYGKDVSIRLTIIDSVINHQETAIIDIMGGIPSYRLEGSIDKTNIQFYSYDRRYVSGRIDINKETMISCVLMLYLCFRLRNQ